MLRNVCSLVHIKQIINIIGMEEVWIKAWIEAYCSKLCIYTESSTQTAQNQREMSENKRDISQKASLCFFFYFGKIKMILKTFCALNS